MLRTNLADLTPLQIAIVSAIFILTLLGAIVAALAFRWWNTRQRAATIDPRGKGNRLPFDVIPNDRALSVPANRR